MKKATAALRCASLLLPLFVLANALPALADNADLSFIAGGKKVGTLHADITGARTMVSFDVKDNGRGPTITETITLDAQGLPLAWQVSGTTTFGSKVDEHFSKHGKEARWQDSSGAGHASVPGAALYLTQAGSPWADGIYARALLKRAERSIPALPSGTLKLEQLDSLDVHGAGGDLKVTHYDLVGINLTPESILLDDRGELFAVVDPNAVLVRSGYEGEEARLRNLAADWSTQRFMALERTVAHHYDVPVRIRNVRIFDPQFGKLGQPMAVVVQGRQIAAVEPLDSPPTPGEVIIDGDGGTLLAGLHEMHGHLSQDEALLNLIAGITTIRDMGNDNAVLDKLIERIDSAMIGGPHVVRSGFIEGKSPYSANNGILVDSEAGALDAVRWYGARGYWQIKIYNSMNPAWVPAMVSQAHQLGMRVAGHIPAFSTADAMMAAGYDEITHINQFMLGWVMQPGEDTRTLFRLTALKRLPSLDLQSAAVQHTVDTMVARHIAIDPTLGIHEHLLLGRDGQIPPGEVDYFSHMPIGWRRNEMKALVDASNPQDDRAYRGAFEKIIATVRLLNERGVFMVFGTDTGGSFTYHRELELYQGAGMTPAQILTRATFESARYLGQEQRLGSIEKGKLADFFLMPGDPTQNLKAVKAISLVVKDGTLYFPAEVYPHFGIAPFQAPPRIVRTGAEGNP